MGDANKMDRIKSLAPHIIAVIASLVFLDSLRFKYTNAPETQVIFGKLDAWAESFGAGGLFAQTGLFSQYVIGTAELAAAALLLLGIMPAFPDRLCRDERRGELPPLDAAWHRPEQ